MTATTETTTAVKRIFDDLLEYGIKPNVDIIAPIVASGRIACVAWQMGPEAQPAARACGWDGQAVAWAAKRTAMRRMARNCAEMADHVTARWINSDRAGRIFVFLHGGTFLLNLKHDPNGCGYSIAFEPGSVGRAMA